MKKKYSYLTENYLEISAATVRLGVITGLFAGILALAYVFASPDNLYIILAEVAILVVGLIKTVGLNEGYVIQVKYSMLMAITGGIATFVGSYFGYSGLFTTLILCCIVPFIGLTAGSTKMIAALALFTVDMFVIGTGVPANFLVAVYYGFSFCIGGIILISIFYLVNRYFTSPNFSDIGKQEFSIRIIFKNCSEHYDYMLIITTAVVVANIISYYFNLLNGFWIPMTALLILKSDYKFSKTRINHRFVGTILGSIVVFILFFFVFNQLLFAILLFPVFFFIIIAFAKHYGSYTFFLTIMVAILYGLFIPNRYETIEYRVIDTVIGIAAAITILYLVRYFLEKKHRLSS